SGNLLACLLALRNGLAEKQDETFPTAAVAEGLFDTLELAAEADASAVIELRAHLQSSPQQLLTAWDEWLGRADLLTAKLPASVQPLRDLLDFEIRSRRLELATFCPWTGALPGLHNPPPGSADVQATAKPWLTLLNELNTPASVRQWAERLPLLKSELEGWA